MCVPVEVGRKGTVLFKLGLKVLELSCHLFMPRRGDFKLGFDRMHGLQYPPCKVTERRSGLEIALHKPISAITYEYSFRFS